MTRYSAFMTVRDWYLDQKKCHPDFGIFGAVIMALDEKRNTTQEEKTSAEYIDVPFVELIRAISENTSVNSFLKRFGTHDAAMLSPKKLSVLNESGEAGSLYYLTTEWDRTVYRVALTNAFVSTKVMTAIMMATMRSSDAMCTTVVPMLQTVMSAILPESASVDVTMFPPGSSKIDIESGGSLLKLAREELLNVGIPEVSSVFELPMPAADLSVPGKRVNAVTAECMCGRDLIVAIDDLNMRELTTHCPSCDSEVQITLS